jgi:hypothetical protein
VGIRAVGSMCCLLSTDFRMFRGLSDVSLGLNCFFVEILEFLLSFFPSYSMYFLSLIYFHPSIINRPNIFLLQLLLFFSFLTVTLIS